jgi:hypothetical protein
MLWPWGSQGGQSTAKWQDALGMPEWHDALEVQKLTYSFGQAIPTLISVLKELRK